MSTLRVDTLQSIDSTFTINIKDLLEGGDATVLAEDLANVADPAKGSAIVGRSVQSVANITALRALLKTAKSTVAVLAGYYTVGDAGGGGTYVLDPADTTSVDNGGTIIVATDGGRWKLQTKGEVNVRQFGAKGDGVTDDRAAIQSAIDTFASNGGRIFVPDGVFAIGGAGVVLRNEVANFNGQVLYGAGMGSTLKKIGTGNAVLSIVGASCTVRDISIDGSSLAETGIITNTAWDGRTTLIENINISQIAGGGQGIFNVDGDAYTIRNSRFLNAGNWAWESLNNGMNSTFEGNFVQGCGMVHLMSSTQQAEGVRILNNTGLISGGSGYGIDVEFGLEIIIGDNIIDQVTLGCVRVRNNSSYVKMHDNWFAGNCANGHVTLGDNANSITITNNTFEGGTNSQIICNSGVLGMLNSIIVQGNQHNNIVSTGAAMIFINVLRALIANNIVHGTGGLYSIYWNTGSASLILGNITGDAITSDGVGVTLANNITG